MLSTRAPHPPLMPAGARFRDVGEGRRGEFVARGLRPSRFFPHRFHVLPKCGPDGFKLARRACGPVHPEDLWEVVLYATGPVLEDFPADLFHDDDLVWHQQQFGRPGQIATANVAIVGDRLLSMVHVSDVVQRISRRREHKTRIENRFAGWAHLLLNAVASFAIERGCTELRTPTSVLALAHTDPRRAPGTELFERVYDRTVHDGFRPERESGWWVIDLRRERDRVVQPTIGEEPLPSGRTVCVVHDVERGLGHRDVDPAFAARADERAAGDLDTMLEIESAAGVRATYAVVGSLLGEVRAAIARGGHALAFHSFDHRADRLDQLGRCREVDYRLKGYRLTRSRRTAETTDENLLFHNFEWLASSAYAFGFDSPVVENRLVKVPVTLDDFALHESQTTYAAWRRSLAAELERRDFLVLSLHDCYAGEWLAGYRDLLRELGDSGPLVTLDQVAARTVFAHAA